MKYTDYKEPIENIKKAGERGFKYYISELGVYMWLILLGISSTLVSRLPYAEIKEHITTIIPLLFVWVIGFFVLLKVKPKEKEPYTREEIIKDVIAAFDEREERKIKEHDERAAYRIKNSPRMSLLLKDLLIHLNASRVAVLEMHNGTNNMAGIPFLYAEMTHEEVDHDIKNVSGDYEKVNIIKYNFITQNFNNGFWYGTIDDVRAIDPKFANLLETDDCKYFCGIILHGLDKPLGFLITSYNDMNDVPAEKKTITQAMNTSAQKISTILDGKAEDEEDES